MHGNIAKFLIGHVAKYSWNQLFKQGIFIANTSQGIQIANSNNISDETFSRFKYRELDEDEIIFRDEIPNLDFDLAPNSDPYFDSAPMTKGGRLFGSDDKKTSTIRLRCEKEVDYSAPFSPPDVFVRSVDEFTNTPEIKIDSDDEKSPTIRLRSEEEVDYSAPFSSTRIISMALPDPTLIVHSVDENACYSSSPPTDLEVNIDIDAEKSPTIRLRREKVADYSAPTPNSRGKFGIDADETSSFVSEIQNQNEMENEAEKSTDVDVQQRNKDYYRQCMQEVVKLSHNRDKFKSKLHVLIRSQAEKYAKAKPRYNYDNSQYQFHKNVILPMCQKFNIDYNTFAKQCESGILLRTATLDNNRDFIRMKKFSKQSSR